MPQQGAEFKIISFVMFSNSLSNMRWIILVNDNQLNVKKISCIFFTDIPHLKAMVDMSGDTRDSEIASNAEKLTMEVCLSTFLH